MGISFYCQNCRMTFVPKCVPCRDAARTNCPKCNAIVEKVKDAGPPVADLEFGDDIPRNGAA